MFKEQKGITLVALVITIIVLLILAGVSISLVVGQNGILGKATKAVNENAKANAFQEVKLGAADALTDYYATWANNQADTHKGKFLTTKSYYTSNASAGAVINVIAGAGVTDASDTGVVTVEHTPKGGDKYTFYVSIKTGEVTDTEPTE